MTVSVPFGRTQEEAEGAAASMSSKLGYDMPSLRVSAGPGGDVTLRSRMSYAKFLLIQLGIFMAAGSLLLMTTDLASTVVSMIGLLSAAAALLAAVRMR